jgi:hypothetical protein
VRPGPIAGFVLALGGVLVACSALDPEVGVQRPACMDVDSDPANPVSFHAQIRPLMDRLPTDPTGHGCKTCHYQGQPAPTGIQIGGLDLTTLMSLRAGGNSSHGTVVIPGKPCESAIVQKLQGAYPLNPSRMPKDGPPFWTDDQIQLVIDWIAEGAQGMDNE